MATVIHHEIGSTPVSSQGSIVHYFDDATEQRHSADDTAAWTAVAGVLLTILSLGLTLGVFSVLLAIS